ncbi:NAD-dependent protein deacetylase sirtuin-2 [Aplysia californica]|uniref:NAD-dependent protein deacetylase sirtuin-2 n=1 Tax=Aplysia californica TaxID=6500 RepID=A0ABM0JQZ2_APLCA|nr:NAD-dependent protein deacetylase sirtuin-2 [Aplysia californica]
MKRIMATAASAGKGQMKPVSGRPGPGGHNKSPSLSPSPPLHPSRRFAGNSSARSGHQSDSDSGITSGMRDLNLRQRTPTKHFENRRTFCSNGSRTIVRNLTDVANMLKDNHAKNVVIVAGAGISTPSGIPDFRTPGTGLYDNLQQYNVPYPEAIFDIDFFHHNPRPFFALAKELYPSGKYRPNYIHYFARLLNDRGVLLRMYTQNIDGLERLAGVPPDKMVEAHGTFSSASCVICEEKYRGAEIKESIFEERLPKCKRRGCPGIVKPDIVFFGEELPKRFYFYLKDMLQTDLVLVMGTSLEVQPFAGIIDTVRWTVPRVLFNRNAVGPFKNGKRAKDFISEGDLIERLQSFAHSAGMKEEMVDLITQCEGTFRLAAPPPPEAPSAKVAAKVNPAHRTDPLLAAMWRQNARSNLYSDSETTESSDFEDSDSDSSSSGEKKPMNKRTASSDNGRATASPAAKPRNAKLNSSAPNSSPISRRAGPLSVRPPSGKAPPGAGNKTNNGSSSSRNYSSTSLLSRRRENGKPPTPVSTRRVANSPTRPENGSRAKEDASWTGNGIRRKPQIDVALNPHRKPPQAPGSHAAKPRSSSVNKAAPEKLHSKTGGGFRSVIDRVRSAKPPPRLVYHHKPSPKPVYDARILAFNASNSSSSDDDDDDRDDVDDDSSSDDSR